MKSSQRNPRVHEFCISGKIQGNVVRILDGDTVEILVDRQPIRVRLAAIDAPEKKQPFGSASRQSLADLVFRHDVTVSISATDRYGRSIGTIYDQGLNVNATQVKLGMAWAYRKYSHDPALIQLENERSTPYFQPSSACS